MVPMNQLPKSSQGPEIKGQLRQRTRMLGMLKNVKLFLLVTNLKTEPQSLASLFHVRRMFFNSFSLKKGCNAVEGKPPPAGIEMSKMSPFWWVKQIVIDPVETNV